MCCMFVSTVMNDLTIQQFDGQWREKIKTSYLEIYFKSLCVR